MLYGWIDLRGAALDRGWGRQRLRTLLRPLEWEVGRGDASSAISAASGEEAGAEASALLALALALVLAHCKVLPVPTHCRVLRASAHCQVLQPLAPHSGATHNKLQNASLA
eukprot:2625096-Prymnesium_polylepis.1